MGRSAVVIGAGITGAAAVWQLGQLGYAVRVFEREQVVGGHVRTEWMHGIPYEPHGAHIFHTTDEPVWRLVTKLADFVPYRHRVVIRVRGQLIPWPIQRSAVSQLPDGAQLVDELDRRPTSVDTTNFETYCVSLLGRTLYDECVGPYTVKQWGRDPHTLSASVATGRVELRDDGYLDFFRDPFQGWPRAGYGMLVEAMLQEAEVNLGTTVTADHMSDVAARGEPVIVTSALDDFFAEPGALPWRGVRLESMLLRGVALAQPAMVVNEPALAVPWTRTIETKWALDDLHDISGTVVMREFPGADAKHYPVLDAAGTNLATQASLERRLTAFRRNPILPAGRLAGYSYINMDVAVRRGLNAATQIATEAHR